jgi:hypothetical protein
VSKEYILSRISEKDIFEYYLKINIKYSTLISSPFRKDNNPSFGLRVIGDTIIAKDFSTNDSYDCFSLVQKLYNCTFKESLKIIYTDFNLGTILRYKRQKAEVSYDDTIKAKEGFKSQILIEKQEFTQYDLEYWKQYSINLDILKKFQVYSCKTVVIDTYIFKKYNRLNPIFAYDFGNCFKIYSPLDKNRKNKWRFSGTSDILEGYNVISSIIPAAVYPSLVIAKSLKDVMCLYMCGIPAISLISESTQLKPEIYNVLSKKFNKIVSLYDNDSAGIKGANTLYEQYGIEALFIPKESNCKDFADYVKEYGLDKAKELIDSLLNN